jgi:glyoxylase-like metal-dependent hydrolase (beta-lactamase superfamily II)
MFVKRVVVGELQTNCYILESNHEVLIIDPGADFLKIKNSININDLVVGVVVTHSHFDHIGALNEVINYYNVPYYSMNNLLEGENNISNFKFDVIYTKGHLDDSITLYFKNIKSMFVGDFIFASSIGRVDMEGSNINDMIDSLKRILEYENVTIYPGHGMNTTLDNERNTIKYFIKELENNL